MRAADRACFAAVRDAIGPALAAGNAAFQLPAGGQLLIERPVPFLVLVDLGEDDLGSDPHGAGRPWSGSGAARADHALARLTGGMAARLIWPSDPELEAGVAQVLGAALSELGRRFPAICVIRLRSRPPGEASRRRLRPPYLRVRVTDEPRWDRAGEAFEQAFEGAAVDGEPLPVTVVREPVAALPGPAPAHRTCGVEVEIEALHRDERGRLRPLLLADLHGVLHRGLSRALSWFVAHYGPSAPSTRTHLGTSRLDAAAVRVDHVLADAANSFAFLLQLTPANLEQVWQRLLETDFSEEPRLRYWPLPLDPVALKRRIYDTPLEEVGDPFVAELLREKQEELDRLLSMLRDRGETFLHESEQLFGRPDGALIRLARRILATPDPPEGRGGGDGERIGGQRIEGEALLERARAHMLEYRAGEPLFPNEIEVRDDIAAGMMVSRGRLLVRADLAVSDARLGALLEHEVGTHVVTWFNGAAQPLSLLGCGLAGYEALQEGLAVLAEHLSGALDVGRLRVIAARVLAADGVVRGEPFLQIFHRLVDEHDLPARSAFQTTMRALRGGGMTKDIAYLRGLLDVIEHLHDGGGLEGLYVGKIALRHMPVIDELRERGILAAPRVLPRILDSPVAQQELSRLRAAPDAASAVLAMCGARPRERSQQP